MYLTCYEFVINDRISVRINVHVLAVSLSFSPTGLVPYPSTPTTFGDLRAANGQGQQRRRITSIQPPTGLQEWLRTFQVRAHDTGCVVEVCGLNGRVFAMSFLSITLFPNSFHTYMTTLLTFSAPPWTLPHLTL